MRKICLSIINGLCIVGLANSFAQSTPEIQNWTMGKGFYLSGNIGTNGLYAFLPTGNEGDVVGWGAGISVGYNFIPALGLEAGYIYSSDLNYDIKYNSASGSASGRLYIPYLAFKFDVPLYKKASLFFKLGAMYPYGKADLSGSIGTTIEYGRISAGHILPFSGIGAAYAFTPKLSLNVTYQGAAYVLAGAGALSLGLTYRINQA